MTAARIAQLTDAINRHTEARALIATTVWKDQWNTLEQELLERLLQCGPTDDAKRYRLQTAIEVARTLRRLIESQGISTEQLERELAYLDGSKLRPVA